jgi:riboflavin transporter FmnP
MSDIKEEKSKQRLSVRMLAAMGVFAAISVVLVLLVHFPIIPAAPFLEYDPADIPILIVAFAYGPVAGLTVTLVAALVQGLTVSAGSGPYGIIMHIISTGSLVVTAGAIYHFKHTKKGAAIALVIAVLVSAAVMVPANLIVTPIYSGAPVEVVKAMLLPAIIPFNLIKSGANALVTFFVYKHISRIIKREAEAAEA